MRWLRDADSVDYLRYKCGRADGGLGIPLGVDVDEYR